MKKLSKDGKAFKADDSQIKKFFKLVDKDGDGEISFPEFEDLIKNLKL